MKLTESTLKRIILEEQAKLTGMPMKVTPEYINRIIKEELEAFNQEKRLQESRRRRIQEAARNRRRALKRRRK
tara:strand:+ start:1462 stop:1680 length:219 start_codon:yes stop_codon:yes gene_type:complete